MTRHNATKATIAPASCRLTGITQTSGQCDCCTRPLTQRVFAVIDTSTGTEYALGRRCAAKATGYAPNAVEREARIAARLVEIDRRRKVIAAAFPTVAAAWAARDVEYARVKAAGHSTDRVYGTQAAHVGDTALCEDAWWGGHNRTAYATWQGYITANI